MSKSEGKGESEMITTLETETRRIEVVGVELDRKEILVDFEFDSVLVNFSFRESDLPMLRNLIATLEKEFAEWEVSE